MSIRDMVDAVARCVKCGAKPGACGCWIRCYCGWLKERGTGGCRRCSGVAFVRVAPSTYEAAVGGWRVRTEKIGIHWRYAVTNASGAVVASQDGFGTNIGAKAIGTAGAFRLGAESPPPHVVARSPGAKP
jgi:hypothetical protein